MNSVSRQYQMARENIIKVVQESGKPPCFETKVQYAAWLEAEGSAGTEPFRGNICDDCQRSFKFRMARLGRCVNPQLEVKEDDRVTEHEPWEVNYIEQEVQLTSHPYLIEEAVAQVA